MGGLLGHQGGEAGADLVGGEGDEAEVGVERGVPRDVAERRQGDGVVALGAGPVVDPREEEPPDALALVAVGATRIGASAGVQLVQALAQPSATQPTPTDQGSRTKDTY